MIFYCINSKNRFKQKSLEHSMNLKKYSIIFVLTIISTAITQQALSKGTVCSHIFSAENIYKGLHGTARTKAYFPFEINPATNMVKLGYNTSEFMANKEVHSPDATRGRTFTTVSVMRPSPFYNTELNLFKFIIEKLPNGSQKLVSTVKMDFAIDSFRPVSDIRYEISSVKNGVYSGKLGADNFPFKVDTKSGLVQLGPNKGSEFIANREVHIPSAIDGRKFETLSVFRPSPFYNLELNIYKFQFEILKDGSRKVYEITRLPIYVNLGQSATNFKLTSTKNDVYQGTIGADKFPFKVDYSSGVVQLGANKGSEFIANREVHYPDVKNGKKYETLSVFRPSPYYNTELNIYKFQFEISKGGRKKLTDVTRMSMNPILKDHGKDHFEITP